MQLQTYVFFNGRCDEAIEFYKKALGAKVNMLTRFNQNPEPMPNANPANAEKVMHANVTIGDSVLLMSDGQCQGAAKFEGFSLTVAVKTDDEAKRVFAALSDGGRVGMPLAKTFFSSSFGMLHDRFGINWMVIVQSA